MVLCDAADSVSGGSGVYLRCESQRGSGGSFCPAGSGARTLTSRRRKSSAIDRICGNQHRSKEAAIKLAVKNAAILLLSSDALIRTAVQEILERAGYVVLPARDLGEAVERMGECAPQLLIVSSYTDNISGHAAAVYLRTKCHGLAVLVLNGFPDDVRIRNREKVRCFEIFPEPFRGEELLGKIGQMLLIPAPCEETAES